MSATELNKNSRDGTSQYQRFPKALEADYVRLDERDLEQLLDYVHKLAKHVNFHDLSDDDPTGDWQSFFDSIATPKKRESLIQTWGRQADHKPHIALIIAFLKLFQQSQKQLNLLKEKHLDFYFREILQLLPRAVEPDNVHVLFELAKHVKEHKIPAGTILKAETENGVTNYKTENELIVNRAEIADLKLVFFKRRGNIPGGRLTDIYSTPVLESIREIEANPNRTKTKINENIGFAFASPLLFLEEGLRKIHFTIKIEDDSIENLDENKLKASIYGGFNFAISGQNDWIDLSYEDNEIEITKTSQFWEITIPFVLNEDLPPVSSFNPEKLEGQFSTAWPVIKATFKNSSPTAPDRFCNTVIRKIAIRVNAQNVRNFVLQNDKTIIDHTKPFFPFTSNPSIGSKLYICCKEAFQKSLNYLKFSIDLGSVPSFETHYQYYLDDSDSSGPIKDSSFKVKLEKWEENSWKNIPGSSLDKHGLFNGLKNGILKEISFGEQNGEPILSFEPDPSLELLQGYNESAKTKFFKLSLTDPNLENFSAFGHDNFPKIFAREAIAFAKNGKGTGIPNPPYTPEIQSLSLDYESYKSWELDKIEQEDTIQFFHLTPFGHYECRNGMENCHRVHARSNFPFLLPSFLEEAYVYVGLKRLEPPQSVSLLFQLAVGTNDPNTIILSEDLNWSYLSNDKWISLESHEVLRDTTNQLKSSGIISLFIPEKASCQNNRMPEDIHWLRLSLAENKNLAGISRILAIRPNAVIAARLINGAQTKSSSDLIPIPLPAGSVKRLFEKSPAIKSIQQPYHSFGGRQKEQEIEFQARISERLCHKSRAIKIRDYENLILDAFPTIQKVKCLPTDEEGNLLLVVIPDLKNRDNTSVLKPNVSSVLLKKVENYIQNLTSPFLRNRIIIRQPEYEMVTAHCWVKLKHGYDPGYYLNQINEEIVKYMAPWAFDEMEEMHFSNVIYASDMADFLERFPYVDLIYKILLYKSESYVLHSAIGNSGIGQDPIGEGFDFLIASKPYSVLTSQDRHVLYLGIPDP